MIGNYSECSGCVKLEQKLRKYRKAFDTKSEIHDKLNKDYVEIKEQNKRYLEVLRFYADKSMYVRYVSALDGLSSDIDFDKGERARKVLGLK